MIATSRSRVDEQPDLPAAREIGVDGRLPTREPRALRVRAPDEPFAAVAGAASEPGRSFPAASRPTGRVQRCGLEAAPVLRAPLPRQVALRRRSRGSLPRDVELLLLYRQ